MNEWMNDSFESDRNVRALAICYLAVLKIITRQEEKKGDFFALKINCAHTASSRGERFFILGVSKYTGTRAHICKRACLTAETTSRMDLSNQMLSLGLAIGLGWLIHRTDKRERKSRAFLSFSH